MADIIVFGEDWGALPSSTQHLIKQLLPKHRVIWVNSIGMRAPRFSLNDFKRLFQKGFNAIKGFVMAFDSSPSSDSRDMPLHHPIVIQPSVLPFYHIPFIRKLNRLSLVRTLKKQIELHSFTDIVLWTSLPTAVDVFGRLNEQVRIYYCGDDFEGLDGVDHDTIAPMEMELAEKVDINIVVSPALAKKFHEFTTVVLPHGVDYELFSKPRHRPPDLPQGPIAGFYGSVSAWVDLNKIAQAAIALPKWQFVFIGNINTDISVVEGIPNVHFLGPRDHDQLPAYVQHWDVALLPFILNQQIQACNPLKLREYLAAGTPIAATPFPALKEYGELICVQGAREPFAHTILRANTYQGDSALRQQAVEAESWADRGILLNQLIEHLVRKKITQRDEEELTDD